jgi:hypothetical protein
MYLGFDAVKAVEVACALDNGCGNGIDALTLQQEVTTPTPDGLQAGNTQENEHVR